jgi:DNA-binding FadR family transcriptional regulator
MRIIRVFIASPGDVAAERQVVEDLVVEFNDGMGRAPDREFVIQTLNWKKHSGPGVHLLGAQGQIDQRLRPWDCDAMIVILWSRIGENILDGSETGTEHEMNSAFERWISSPEPKKPQIFTYVKSAAIPQVSMNLKQLERLEVFKQQFEPGGRYQQATYTTFTTPSEFKDQLRRDLTEFLLVDSPEVLATEKLAKTLVGIQPSSHSIVVCLVEATFGSNVPPRVVDGVVSGLEDVLSFALSALTHRSLEKGSAGNGSSDPLLRKEFFAWVQPTLVSQYGSSVTLIWDLPAGRLESGIALVILDFLCLIQKQFQNKLDEIGYTLPTQVRKCGLRIILSSGEALKRKSEINGGLIYIGHPLEEVIDLRKLTRPGEIVADLRFAPYLFMERLCAGEGKARALRSSRWRRPVWISDKPLQRRIAKMNPLESLSGVLDWAGRSGIGRFGTEDSRLPALTKHDLVSVFEIRAKWEARFAEELAIRVSGEEAGEALLTPIMETIEQMKNIYSMSPGEVGGEKWRSCGATFHSQIAELSHPVDGANRRKFTEWVYGFTKAVYAYGMVDASSYPEAEGSVVIEEHVHIVELIRKGAADDVRIIVNDHLKQHYDRAHNALLRCV